MAQNQRLETISNNLANANTTAFKKDKQTFHEYVTANEKEPPVMTVPRITASVESFYDMQGADRAYVDTRGTYSDFAQGALKSTGGPLDLAIEGPGFFEVLTADGVKLTRNGSFKTDSEGKLVTNEGHAVLREGTGDPAQRVVQALGRNVTVGFSGELYDGENQIGKLSVIEIDNKDAIQKQGGSLYMIKPNYEVTPRPSTDAKIHQGFVELSNVNVVDEMTDMIQASRVFEATQNAIKAYDQIDDKLANVVPKV